MVVNCEESSTAVGEEGGRRGDYLDCKRTSWVAMQGACLLKEVPARVPVHSVVQLVMQLAHQVDLPDRLRN